MLELLKLGKCGRIGIANAIKIRFLLHGMKRTVTLGSTPYYQKLTLRPNHSDWIAFEQVFRYLGYGCLEAAQPRRIIDAGANIGMSAAYFASRIPQHDIVGIEPEAGNYSMALANTASFPKVEIRNAALWPYREKLVITNRDTAGSLGFQMGVRGENTEESEINIAGITVNEIMESKQWEVVDLIKIDIEGAERALFSDQHYLPWINRAHFIAIELHDWLVPGCGQTFFKALSAIPNYSVSLAGENLIVQNHELDER